MGPVPMHRRSSSLRGSGGVFHVKLPPSLPGTPRSPPHHFPAPLGLLRTGCPIQLRWQYAITCS
ncbi:hypothetical protein STVIR_4268 [Streptomyces viridochromogenes Tue57]|uniref:Uncharacterized protein n=1 Tax=Streptomyces viridochromogenes Tue57 TaxID=1160705 RepID=L8PB45_STRVR|nr:hypothetical protein STVIR_4268 [Streptomyces viridochromogenes Tue57]